MPRVYLAGPDVFLPRPWERGAQLKAICARHGLDGVFPLDGSAPADAVPPAAVISAANEAHIRGCDAVLANLTPFRGPSADSGTVYEIGFARALGLPVVGYSNDPRPYEQRCRTDDPRAVYDGAGWRDGEGLLIEEFGLPENLMIACGIEAGGWPGHPVRGVAAGALGGSVGRRSGRAGAGGPAQRNISRRDRVKLANIPPCTLR